MAIFHAINLAFLVETINAIEVETLKHASKHELEIYIIDKETFTVLFLDMANKEHLGLEFNININKQSVTKFIDTENESALEELNQLPLDKTFECYFAHQESFK